jgi:hypothetical protein
VVLRTSCRTPAANKWRSALDLFRFFLGYSDDLGACVGTRVPCCAVYTGKAKTHPIMNTKLVAISLLSTAVLFAAGARAQTIQAATSAPAAPSVAPAAALAPNQTVYGQRLPSVNELANIAAAQGLAVERIEQTASQITVVYKYANGQTNIVAYLLLPGASAAPAQVAVPTSPAPTVVYYEPAPRVVYYDAYAPSYDAYPSYWYPPVSIGLGFGFRSGGFHGGGFRGGFGFRH